MAALALGATACGGGASTNDAGGPDTNDCVPSVQVCVLDEFGQPAVGATVTASREGAIPSQGTTGADGCVELYPDPGTWDLQARTTSNCLNPMYTLELAACGQHAELSATMCFDG
ncbi:MAG: Ig-like domain-containing protein [Sandaracinaceae bacterium]|nr:Ig-like domain-containing protein [Sandaracinaceae bacterium]